jgi:serine/threonine-protein kinase
MAPEATLGEVEAGQAYLLDIYALGVIAFEMLTGHVPFDAKSPPELLEMHRERPAPPVLRNDVPEALSRLVARMLGKRAADRPDAAAVIAALDAVPGAVPPMARAA